MAEKGFITYLKKNVQNVHKSVSNCSKAILVLLVYDVALYYIFYPETCGHRTVHICDIVKYVSKAKAFVDIFILKMFCLPIGRKSHAIIYGLGKLFRFPQAFETYVWKPKCLKIKLKIVLVCKMTSPLYYWALLAHSSISWPLSWPAWKVTGRYFL